MNRVYLLLRNNKQSGPHSIEELLKLGVKPLDLIWVEGRSFGWSYPSEIGALKPYIEAGTEPSLSPSPVSNSGYQSPQPISDKAYMPPEKPVSDSNEPAPQRKIYVSMPTKMKTSAEPVKPIADTTASDEARRLEQKAEELRKRIQSYVPENKPASKIEKTEEPIVTKYSSTTEDRAEEFSSWIVKQKTKKATEARQKRIALAIAAFLILAIAGFGVTRYHGDKKVVKILASKETPPDNKTIYEPLVVSNETTTTAPATNETNTTAPVTNKTITPAPDTKNNNAATILPEHQKTIIKNNKAIEKPVAPNHKGTMDRDSYKKNAANNKNAEKEIAPPSKAASNTAEIKAAPAKEIATASPKKKKTLNEKVDAFFSKFSRKKEETPAPQEPQVTTQNNSGAIERKAVHRDDKPVATPAENINLADFVQITSNKPSENWMLGIHGLKVTVRNTSNEIMKSAEVELRYYTEQNEVLDKKIVNFNNIPPGKTITLPAPDHRLADHADFRLVAVK